MRRYTSRHSFLFCCGMNPAALFQHNMITKDNSKLKGYLCAIVAAATYGMNPLFALPLYKDGMDTDSVLFFRYVLATVIIGLMIKARGRNFRVSRKDIAPLVLMGFLCALSSLALFLSYSYMEAGIASTILFVYPIFVALIMALFFKERITWLTVFCIVLALSGIGLLYEGKDGATLSTTGIGCVMVSALSYAVYIVGVNQSRLRQMPTVKVTFYVILLGCFLFLGRLLWKGEITFPAHWYLWGNILALAALPTAVSFLATTRAIQYIGSTPTAILGALEQVTAIFFGVMIFGETLTPRLCVGILLILAAVTLIISGGSFSAVLLRFRKLFPKIHRGRRKPL